MRKYFALLAVAALALGSTSLQADQFTWVLDHEFSGAVKPEGWLEVTIADVAADTVRLTVDSYLVKSEHLWYLMLNFDPQLSANSLTWDFANQGTGAYGSPSISTGVNFQQADGDGMFDIQFAFDQNPPEDWFNNADSYYIDVTLTGITADSFNWPSEPKVGGGGGGLYVAAHVQGIDNPDIPGVDDDGSGWVTTNGEVPEASTLMLFGSGLSGLLFYVKKKGLIKL